MPFDNTPETIESRIIDEALRILGPKGENWIKGTEFGSQRVCMLHALNMARNQIGGQSMRDETEIRVVEAIRLIHHRTQQVPDFNDDPERTFDEVVAVLQRAKTAKPSALGRKLYGEYVSPSALVELFCDAERKSLSERKKAMAAEIGTAVGTIAIMLASICIPL
jgi:hypothetical protein